VSQYPGAAGATVPVKSNISPISLQKGESVYVVGVLAAGATQLPVNEGNVAVEEFGPSDPYNASIAVQIAQGSMGDPPPMVCVELHFDSAPGVFELDIQEADTDADAFYITPTNTTYQITAVNAATQNARADISPTGGKFMRVFMKTLTNDADCWVKLTRLA
jgi:hypothetical protein